LSPAKLQSLLQTGVAHHRAGRLEEADAAYRQVRAAAPRNFDALHLSGLIAYQQGRTAEAIALLERAHKLDPKHEVCQMRYAVALLAEKRTADAEKHLRRTVERNPRFFEGWDNLAYCLKTQDRLDEALACHARVVALQPGFANGWYNYGLTLSLCGRSTEALECHRRALAAEPAFALGHFGCAQALHQLDRIAEAVEAYGKFLELEPQHHEARSYRLLALHHLHGVPREQLFAEHIAYGRHVSAGIAPAATFPNRPDPQRRLRLAILSPDLRAHSCAFFLEPLLQHLDSEQFELFLYHDHFREDAVTTRLRGMAATWRNFVGQPAPLVEKTIRADAPDILLDLAGHTGMTNRLPLFARRLAPVQVTYLGYPDTTGVPAMDYRLTDALADPPGEADALATEKLLRFASTAWAYLPPNDAPQVAPRPSVARETVAFGCFNNPAKITDAAITVWARILSAVPGSRLHLKGLGLGAAAARAAFEARFARAGVTPEQLVLLERTPDTKSHLALYHEVDVALDTFPYHGTTTTCEALWMGVPVVSLAGDRHMSRVGVSLLNAIGRAEWLAATADDYVRIAVELARRPEALAAASAALRPAMLASPLLDHAGQAARFGAALRTAWAEWCGRAEMPARMAFAQG
jgi:protein O-GlcNAc transferase